MCGIRVVPPTITISSTSSLDNVRSSNRRVAGITDRSNNGATAVLYSSNVISSTSTYNDLHNVCNEDGVPVKVGKAKHFALATIDSSLLFLPVYGKTKYYKGVDRP